MEAFTDKKKIIVHKTMLTVGEMIETVAGKGEQKLITSIFSFPFNVFKILLFLWVAIMLSFIFYCAKDSKILTYT